MVTRHRQIHRVIAIRAGVRVVLPFGLDKARLACEKTYLRISLGSRSAGAACRMRATRPRRPAGSCGATRPSWPTRRDRTRC